MASFYQVELLSNPVSSKPSNSARVRLIFIFFIFLLFFFFFCFFSNFDNMLLALLVNQLITEIVLSHTLVFNVWQNKTSPDCQQRLLRFPLSILSSGPYFVYMIVLYRYTDHKYLSLLFGAFFNYVAYQLCENWINLRGTVFKSFCTS